MARLQGLTLGQRQKHYNLLVKEAISKKVQDLPEINYEEYDVDNMIRIDVACNEKNVEYILQVYKCDDTFYALRAIKMSVFLIIDANFAHIINPEYLDRNLFPEMNSKVIARLMTSIKRHLRDEERVIDFYKYANKKNPKAALHWLPNCPLQFIETIVAARGEEIPIKLLKILCKKHINILKSFVLNVKNYQKRAETLNSSKNFLKNKETIDEYLDMINLNGDLKYVTFNKKYTKLLIKNCYDRLVTEFSKFHKSVYIPQVVRFLKPNDVKQFLTFTNTADKETNWMYFNTLIPFLVKLPRKHLLHLLKRIYNINYDTLQKYQSTACVENDDTKDKSVKNSINNAETIFKAIEKGGKPSNVYRWYQFVSFKLAFRDLKKFIQAESSPKEKHSMLKVLLACARHKLEHVKTVLQYYHDNHRNASCEYKINFVNSLIGQYDGFRFDDSTWNILNSLIDDVKMHNKCDIQLQDFLVSTIIRSLINDQPVDKFVEKYFMISTLKEFKKKLNEQEQDKVFNYIHNLIVTEISNNYLKNKTDILKSVSSLRLLWKLLKDWNKVREHNQFVIDKVAEISSAINASPHLNKLYQDTRKFKNFNDKIASLFSMLKSNRKLLFEYSLTLNPCEDVCLNALKQDPTLLTRYQQEVDELRCNDKTSLKRFLNKLRIFWPDSLATKWVETNVALLQYCHKSGHSALLRGIFSILSPNNLLNFIKMYNPSDNCIKNDKRNAVDLSIQLHIVKNLHKTRSQIPLKIVLWHTSEAFLDEISPSLYSVFSTIKYNESIKYIQTLLDSSAPLQEHGIRLAFSVLKTDEILKIATKIWNTESTTKIRVIIFKSTFELLCKKNNEELVQSIWLVLCSFIDDLNPKELKIIYPTLVRISDVPLSIAVEWYQKAYRLVQSIPSNAGNKKLLEDIASYAPHLIEQLDFDFIENILLKSVYDIFSDSNKIYLGIISAYLLCSKDVDIQEQKYDRLLQPVVDKCSPFWKKAKHVLFSGFVEFLRCICRDIRFYVFKKKKPMPVNIMKSAMKSFYAHPSVFHEQYMFIRHWQIVIQFLEVLHYQIRDFGHESLTWTDDVQSNNILQFFVVACADTVARDETQFLNFVSFYTLYRKIFKMLFPDFGIDGFLLLKVLYRMLSWEYASIYLLVLEMIPTLSDETDEKYLTKLENIKRKIYFYREKDKWFHAHDEEIRLHYFRKFCDRYIDDQFDESDTESDGFVTD